MSGREWKPGDVGLYDGLRVFYTEADEFVDSEGDARDGDAFNACPLVVIDPENERDIDDLQDALIRSGAHFQWDVLQAALREFANPTPPKPAEPTGLGAVVEDAEGRRWVRTAASTLPWFGNPDAADAKFFSSKRFADIDAVRIVAEGVTP